MSDLNPFSSASLARQKIYRRRWFSRLVPLDSDTRSQNIRRVIIDGIGIGFASAAQPYLPVFLTRLGASNLAIGLLAALPAMSGLLFGLPVGRFLQSRRQVVPSFAVSRLLLLSSYALIGLIPVFFTNYRVEIIIALWALATIPQVFVNICFTLVMGGVAGPEGRYYLMSRRWSILGLTTAVTVALAGQVLDRIAFPLNYEIVFVLLSLGALVSFYYSSHIVLPDQVAPPPAEPGALRKRISEALNHVRGYPLFVRQTISVFVFRLGLSLALPLFPLYYVRNLNVSDASIGWINTVQGSVLIVAYFFWSRISRNLGARFALLTTTLGLALYPLMVALTTSVEGVIMLAGFAGIFQAGIDLVFFDALVSSLPNESSPTFVGIYQTTGNLALFLGPLIGTLLANQITIPGALIAAAVVRLAGFATFFFLYRESTT